MTYWPISSPSVFAATKDTRTETTHTSDDGAESGTKRDDDTESSVADSEDRTESEVSEGELGVAEGEAVDKPGTEHVAEDDISGEIRAIEVTRSGHMFATITRSTLTIWQTKVRLDSQCECPRAQILTHYLAHRHPSIRSPLKPVLTNLWSQCEYSPPTRLANLCGPNCSRLLNHVLPRNRPHVTRLQDPPCAYGWWRAL
jgi:hypothetical protein